MAALELGSFFDSMYTAAVQKMSSSAGIFVTDGQDLAGVLLLLSLSWILAIWVLSQDGVSALMDSFGVIARFSIASVLLASWVSMVGGFFQSYSNDFAQRLSGTSSVSDTVNIILAGAGRLLTSERASEDCDASSATTCAQKPGAAQAAASWTDLLINFPLVLVTWLLRLLGLVFMGLMLAAYLSVIFLAEVSFGLAITMGPVLVPWLVWQRTEWLFDGWLRFTIAASLTKVVAAFMVMATTGLVFALKSYAEATPISGVQELLAVDETTALLLCVICAMGTYLMWQVPSLASGLISGGGMSAGGFGGKALGRSVQNLNRHLPKFDDDKPKPPPRNGT